MALELPQSAEAYRYAVDELVRFGDLDLLGHVNNKSYLGYAESARAPFLQALGLWVTDSPQLGVIVHTAVDFLRELHYPNRLRVGIGTWRIGRSSYALGHGIFCEGQCMALVLTQLVRIERESRRPVALDPEQRQRLLEWALPGSGL